MENRIVWRLGCVLGLLLYSSVLFAAPVGEEIVLGMSTALTGPTAELGRRMRDGVQLGLERINQQGGIQGRPLRLQVYDDGYEPHRVAPNMQRLIDDDHVLAVIGNVGTPTAVAALPVVKSNGVVFFAPFTGAGLLRKQPPEEYVINYRASYVQEITTMIRALVEDGGLDPREIAFFTQRDSYGDAGYVGGVTTLKRYGIDDVQTILHVRYERNTLAVENALADLLFSRRKIRAVIMVGAYAPCAKFIRLAKQSGLDALFLNVSFVGANLLLRDLNGYSDGVVVSQVVPPLATPGVPIVDDYLHDRETFDVADAPDYVSFEGYIVSRILLKALATEGVSLQRAGVVEALEGLGEFDLGLGVPLQLNPQQHQACQKVWGTRFVGGEIVPFDWKNIKMLLNQRTGLP
jgi:ABC-type branched-subunit amino acid transport system substrate-binding protein